MADSDEYRGKSKRPDEYRAGIVAQDGYSVAERSGGRVTPCAVCTVHVKTRSVSFLVEPQN
jgi:hypothetical protein